MQRSTELSQGGATLVAITIAQTVAVIPLIKPGLLHFRLAGGTTGVWVAYRTGLGWAGLGSLLPQKASSSSSLLY